MTEKKKEVKSPEKTKYMELRDLNVNDHVEKKGKFNYLSWACALDILLENDPDATWEYKEPMNFSDGTAMVFCTVTAFGKSRTMQLPVLNYQNKPISNPNAFDLNTAMQRCLAKAIACHGIGLYIYKGEDLPNEEKEKVDAEKTKEKPKKTPEQEAAARISKQLKEATTPEIVTYVWDGFAEDLDKIKAASPDKAWPALEKLYNERIAATSQAPIETQN